MSPCGIRGPLHRHIICPENDPAYIAFPTPATPLCALAASCPPRKVVSAFARRRTRYQMAASQCISQTRWLVRSPGGEHGIRWRPLSAYPRHDGNSRNTSSLRPDPAADLESLPPARRRLRTIDPRSSLQSVPLHPPCPPFSLQNHYPDGPSIPFFLTPSSSHTRPSLVPHVHSTRQEQ
ncbi:hypothetical protein SERLADRAFT_437556 [Serpula lacrymans var. lacrymans S7.9]|uniref:Uncharacterized protein n=1 Tax=Serpula lacrymans var. lacrymans (strain S7.9) TaxID=578457 RepID=F8NU62_SERL9|nr:uncharacterized protein SERLADRAFT_437556 [Serpula lacrymans var. lacrymans S7.9]EGO25828.1 hypothetical protein SERLADRAFT_437556 [Serpula lacrymans var. lacrymans S7.9]